MKENKTIERVKVQLRKRKALWSQKPSASQKFLPID